MPTEYLISHSTGEPSQGSRYLHLPPVIFNCVLVYTGNWIYLWRQGYCAMTRSNMIRSSSRSLCGMMLAMIMASLSLTPVESNSTKNSSSILNGITNPTLKTQIVFVVCSFNFDSYRIVEPMKTVLKPGEEKPVNVDDYPGVKQVECDITRYASAQNRVYNMKAVVWFFNGPSQTRCRFEDDDMHFAILPDLNNFNQGTGMKWGFDQQVLETPRFFESSSTSASSSNEASIFKTRIVSSA